MRPISQRTVFDVVVLTAAAAVALASARPEAGCWNDGSRLATVESLVDRGTFAIDDSIFVVVPPDRNPYAADQPQLVHEGTLDKMRINGHFYSDKPPTSAILLAGCYKAIQIVTGLTAREQPRRFCWLMSLLGAGLAYTIAVWCVWRLALAAGLPVRTALLLPAVLGLATVALPYARQVSGHIQVLAVTSALLLLMVRCGRSATGLPGKPLWRLAAIGALAGLGYAGDNATGFFLLTGVGAWALLRFRESGPARVVAAIILGALPFVGLHHAVTYAVAGTIGPPGAVAEYFDYPGSFFNAQTLTGRWNHPSLDYFQAYLQKLLIGENGFLLFNPILFLAYYAVPLLRRRLPERLELLVAGYWIVGTVLLYGATSIAQSGGCVSIRWFVPLLAPGLLFVAVLLRERPTYRGDALILAAASGVLAVQAWRRGPWREFPTDVLMTVATGGIACWSVYRGGCWTVGIVRWWARRSRKTNPIPPVQARAA
ncbi:MAG: hypothetical protein ACJ8F7_21005 [Gemmataceae bacterium]